MQTDWKVGSPILFRGEWNGQTFEDKGEIVTFEPERELAYSHFSPMMGKPDEPENYHLVDITLDGGRRHHDGDARAVEPHRRRDRRGPRHREQFEQNWQQMLDGLRDTVEQ